MSNATNIRVRLESEFEEEGVTLRDESGEIKDSDSGKSYIELHGDGQFEEYSELYKEVCDELGVQPRVEDMEGNSFVLKPMW